jgi:protease I
MKSLIITWENFQDQELVYPYYRLREEAYETSDVVVMSNVVGKFFGIMGSNMESHQNVVELHDVKKFDHYLNEFHLLVLPGGVKALEKLRQEKQVIRFISSWNKINKPIASTCHGAQLLISAKVVDGKKVSGYYSIEDDINNAGAIYTNDSVVVDGNLVTSPHYNWMGEWMAEAIKMTNNFHLIK